MTSEGGRGNLYDGPGRIAAAPLFTHPKEIGRGG